MTLNETVLYYLVKGLPLLNSAIDVYDMLFCMNGNGFYWKNGELINDTMDKTFPIYDYVDCKIVDMFNDFQPRNRYYNNMRYVFEFYPLSIYSKMCDFPDNIKPDWFAGIKKMVELIEAHTECINPQDYAETMKWLDFIKEKIRKYEATL